MIIFSFSLAFFLGREVTLSGENSPSLQRKKLDNPSVYIGSPSEEEQKIQMENESKHEYALLRTKANGDKKQEKKTNTSSEKENKQEIDTTKKADQVKKNPKQETVLYGLLIESYNKKQDAAEKAAQLKLRFPKWKILFKKSKDLYKVYIGPFVQKEKAENFLKEIQQKPDFSSVKMEQI